MNKERQATLKLVEVMTQEQIRWVPAPGSNHIGFILLNLFRSEDVFIHTRLTSGTQIWDKDGWAKHWKLPPPSATTGPLWSAGNGWTAEDVASFQVPPLKELLAYGQAVRDETTKVLTSFNPTRLDEPMNPANPQPIKGLVLRILMIHESEHRGHVELLTGIMKARA